MKMLHVDAPHFNAGAVVVYDDTVFRAAPILNYMIGWTLNDAIFYARSKGWLVEVTDATR